MRWESVRVPDEAVVRSQQQTIQHHEHSDKVRSGTAAQANAAQWRAALTSDHTVPKQGSVVEQGQVIVKDILPTEGVDPTDCEAAL